MIVKRVAAQSKRMTEARSIELLILYITNPADSTCLGEHISQSKNKTCSYFTAVNYFCDPNDINALCQETIDLAEQKHVNASDVINHYILSCDRLRYSTNQDIDFIVNALITKLNILDCQYLYGRHDDSESTHIHLMVNRVNPATYQTHCMKTSPMIKLGPKAKAPKLKKRKKYKSSKARPTKTTSPTYTEIELKTGFENPEKIIHALITPILESSRSWGYLHLRLRELGMSLVRSRRGFVVSMGSYCVKALNINKRFSKKNLESKFGPFIQQSTPIAPQFKMELPEVPIQLISDDKLRTAVFQIYLQERETFLNLKALLGKTEQETYEKEIEDYKIVINAKLKQLVEDNEANGVEIAKNLREQLELYKTERQAYSQRNAFKLRSEQTYNFDKWCTRRNIDIKQFYQLSATKNLDKQRLKIRLDRATGSPLDRLDDDLSILPAPEPEDLFGWINCEAD